MFGGNRGSLLYGDVSVMVLCVFQLCFILTISRRGTGTLYGLTEETYRRRECGSSHPGNPSLKPYSGIQVRIKRSMVLSNSNFAY